MCATLNLVERNPYDLNDGHLRLWPSMAIDLPKYRSNVLVLCDVSLSPFIHLYWLSNNWLSPENGKSMEIDVCVHICFTIFSSSAFCPLSSLSHSLITVSSVFRGGISLNRGFVIYKESLFWYQERIYFFWVS